MLKMRSIGDCSEIKGKNNMVFQDRGGITFAIILEKIERWIVLHVQIFMRLVGIFCFGVGRNLDVCSGEPPVI